LNIKRAQARRQPDKISTVNQPFNPDTFNFTKIKEGEVLLELVRDGKSDIKETNTECSNQINRVN